MSKEKSKKNSASTRLDRRDFLRSTAAGGATLGLGLFGRKSNAQPLEGSSAQNAQELRSAYPGAQVFEGAWRLRIDRQNNGLEQQWHKQEPSDSVAQAVSVTAGASWQEFIDFPGGVGWYFKDFRIGDEQRGKVLRIKFWAVDYLAQVWLNGEEVGSHEGGYTPFELDITRQARIGGENHLVVRVVDPPRPFMLDRSRLPGWEERSTGGPVEGLVFNRIPHGPQFSREGFNLGGIWQPVELLSTPPVYISDLFIEPKLDEGSIQAHLEIVNTQSAAVEQRLAVQVRPWKGEQATAGESERAINLTPGLNRVSIAVTIRNPRPWSLEDPHLYLAEASLRQGANPGHQTTARFGLRHFTVKDGHFYLNGRRIYIKGGHYQGTYPLKLFSPPSREFAYREMEIVKEAGFNFMRLWVRPAPMALLDAADEMGMLLQEEPPFHRMLDSPQMMRHGLREVTELVRRDRNRPAIVIWNMINELAPTMKVIREICEQARDLDPTRLITETAGGDSHLYLPYSKEAQSYLTEHSYPGGPITEDVYDYWEKRGRPGVLFVNTEYGFGGMDDVEAVLASYGDNPKKHMEDYRGYVRLKQERDRLFRNSEFRTIFGSMEKMREASQALQADMVRLHTDAMRANPAMDGYNIVQVFDSNALEVDGVVDFWRNKRKTAFAALQEINRPLLLIVHSTPMNARPGEEVRIKVTLANEEQVSGRKRLSLKVISPSGREVHARSLDVEAKPWISVLAEERVRITGEPGRYRIEVALQDGAKQLTKREDFFTLIESEASNWPEFALLDPERHLEPFFQARGIKYAKLGLEVDKPLPILVAPFTGLWRQPEEFRKLIRLFGWIEQGCAAIFLGVPSDGDLSSVPISDHGMLSAIAFTNIAPFRMVARAERWGQRIGPYSWGLAEGDPLSGLPIPDHPIFAGLPRTGLMGREYGNVMPTGRINTDRLPVEEIGRTVTVHACEQGKILITTHQFSSIAGDALAERLLRNLVGYARQGLPAKLGPVTARAAETIRFKEAEYQDIYEKFIQADRRGAQ